MKINFSIFIFIFINLSISINNFAIEYQKTPSFIVNNTRFGAQADPSIAELKDGGLLIVWHGTGENGHGIYGQIYDHNYLPVGSEFKVNTQKYDGEFEPRVATLKNGGFVVTWFARSQTYNSGVYARVYKNNYSPIGPEFKVSADEFSENPTVATLQDGQFVITWASNQGILARAYGQNGTPLTQEFEVSTKKIGTLCLPIVSPLNDGGFAITWSDLYNRQENSEDKYYEDEYNKVQLQGYVAVRIFDKNYLPVKDQFQINKTFGYSANVYITNLKEGGFIAVRDGIGPEYPNGIYAQIYDSNYEPVGDEFRINQTTEIFKHLEDWGNQLQPTVRGLKNGGFVVTWFGNGKGANVGIFARIYDSDHNPITDEFLVNDNIEYEHVDPLITALENGGFAITWWASTGEPYNKT